MDNLACSVKILQQKDTIRRLVAFKLFKTTIKSSIESLAVTIA
jgi:hypothetical protein